MHGQRSRRRALRHRVGARAALASLGHQQAWAAGSRYGSSGPEHADAVAVVALEVGIDEVVGDFGRLVAQAASLEQDRPDVGLQPAGVNGHCHRETGFPYPRTWHPRGWQWHEARGDSVAALSDEASPARTRHPDSRRSGIRKTGSFKFLSHVLPRHVL